MLRKLGLWLVGVAAIAALGGSGAALPAVASTSDWNQYQHDAAHTGSSPALGPTRPAVLPGWPVECSGFCDWGPVVAQVGATGRSQPVAFTGSSFERTVFAYGIDGRPLPGGWPAELAPGIFNEGVGFPAVDTTGASARIFATAFYGDTDPGSLHALDERAQPQPGAWPWHPPTGTRIDTSPPTLVEGTQGDPSRTTVYQAYYDDGGPGGDGYLTALGANGSPRPGWPVRFDQGFPAFLGGSPAVGPDGTVYVVLDQLVGGTPPWDRSVRVDAYASDGTHKSGWPVNLGEGESVTSMLEPPAVGSDGTLYVGVQTLESVGGNLKSGWIYAIARDGRIKPGWPVRPEGGPLFTPVLAKNGTVYVSTFWADTGAGRYENRVYALDAAGRTRPGWPLVFESSSGWGVVIYGMASDAAANIYFAIHDNLYAYGPDGQAVAGWPFRVAPDRVAPDRVLLWPALAGNGVLGNGILYVLAYRDGDPFSMELYAIGNSKTSVRPAPKRPLPSKKTIDDFTATPGAEPPMPQWLKR